MNREQYRIKIGYAPTRREGIGPAPEPAREMRDRIRTRVDAIIGGIHDVELVDIGWLNDEGLLFSAADARKVGRYFVEQNVDAVFMPGANFGCEEAAGIVGKIVGKPFLLWGPRDGVPPDDFTDRPLDVQCGLFVSGMALRRYGVPFDYIENCWLDSPVLEEGIRKFVRIASVVKTFRSLRIGQISLRPQPFLSVMYNEAELLERFGVEVVPIEAGEILGTMRGFLEAHTEKVRAVADKIRRETDCSHVPEERVNNTAALILAIKALREKYDCTAFATECWTVIADAYQIWPCYAIGELADEGLPVGCETDIIGAVTTAMMAAAARGETPAFLADLTIRNPVNDNSELLWHCGPFPRSLARPDCHCCMAEPSIGQYEIAGGDITIGRLGFARGQYSFLIEEVRGCEGPSTCGTYVWVETENWPKLERKFVCGPYVHHVGCVHGKYADVMEEALKYLGSGEIVRDRV